METGVRFWIVLLFALLLAVPVMAVPLAAGPETDGNQGAGPAGRGAFPTGRSSSRSAGQPDRPDIVLSNLSWSLAGPYDGAGATIFAEVFNDGISVNSPFTVEVYTDGEPAGSAVVNSLSAGNFTTVKMPWTVSAGTHELRAVADASDRIPESNETNNFRVENLDIPYPDLTIVNVSWYPESFREGDKVTFAATIANQGSGGTTRQFVLEAFIDQERLSNRIFGGLGAGSTTLATLQWSAGSGNHTLYMTVDPVNAVKESNELNNRHVERLGQQFPDLVLNGLTVTPSEPTDGAPSVLSARVENRGNGATTQHFTVAFVLDGETAGAAGVYGLAVNGSATVSTGWRARAGHHDLRAVADIYSEVAESVESNNFMVRSLDVPYPDLTVKEVRWEPTVPTDGRQVRLNVTVSNTGDGPTAREFAVGIMVDGVLTGTPGVTGLLKGEVKNVTANWTASPGNHELRALVDATREAPELDETNNALVKSLDVPFPDISVTNFNVSPLHPDPGAPVTLRASVRNAGAGNTSRYFEVKFFAAGKEAGTASFDGLSAGALRNLSVMWNAEPGACDLAVKADARNDIRELSELNNSASVHLDVPFPDLTVTGMQWTPANATAGQPVNVSVGVRNAGPGNESAAFVVSLYANGTLMRSDPISGLRAGENASVNFSFNLPSSPVLLRAEVDAQRTIVELSETNNNLTMHYPNGTAVAPAPPPDISLSELRLFPEKPVDGDSVSIVASVKVSNLTTDSPLGIDVLLVVDAQKIAVRKVDTLAGEGLATFDWKAVPGIHSISVLADPLHLIPERTADNDWLSASLAVLPPDLAVADLRPSQPTATDGESAAVFCSLSNLGPGDTRNEIATSFYVDGELVQVVKQGGLPAGRSGSLVFSFTALPGAHRLRAVANPGASLTEASYTNDLATSQITVGRPDIVVAGIAVPDVADEGDSVAISATLANIGAGTVRDIQVAILVDAVQIARQQVFGLPAGRTATVSKQWTTLPGLHMVTVMADTSSSVGEANESNNWLSLNGIQVELSDLSMRDLSVERPPVEGADSIVSARLQNTGSATMRDVGIGFYLDERLVKAVHLGGLPANSSYVISQTFPVGPGLHTLKASADMLGSVQELDETNNDALLELDLEDSPDLTLTGLKVPPAAVDGEEAHLFAEIENSGAANFTDRFVVTIFVDGLKLADCPVEGLVAGGSSVVTARWIASPGMHHFRAIADPQNAIPEANETDNELHREGASVEQPDLTVGEVSTVKGLGQAGTDAFTVFATVENIGGTTLRQIHMAVLADTSPLGNIVLRGLPGRNATQVSFPVHALNPGSITVIADVDDLIAENNEFDNEASAGYAPVYEEPGMRPDLTVTDISVSPAEPADGQTAVVFVTVANIGNASLAAGVDLSLSPDNGNDSQLTIYNLLPGGSAVLGFPWTAMGGTTEFNATVDAQNAQPEWNKDNNWLVRSADVLLPDYRISGLVRWSSTEGLGNPMFVTVENRGTGDTVRPCMLDVFIRGELFVQKGFNGLLSGEQLSLAVPWEGVSGDNDILLWVDRQGLTPETDESNNLLTDLLYSRYPELSMGNISWTPHIDNGSLLSVFAEVQNTGTGATGRPVHVSFSVDSRIIENSVINGLPANSTTLLTWKWSLEPGNHSFSAMVDSADEVWEPDENNNRLDIDFPSGRTGAPPAFLNIRLTNLTFHGSRNQTGRGTENILTLFITLENDGQQNLTGSLAAVMADSLLLFQIQVPPLPATGKVVIAYPWDAEVANHTVKVLADSLRQFPEDIETDNDLTLYVEMNEPPYADAGRGYKAMAGDPITFHGGAHDLDGFIALYEWDLNGDGNYEYNSTVTGTVQHVYYSKGNYTVHLRITDDQGATAVSTAVVVIELREVKPLIRADEVTFVAVILSLAVLAAAAVMLYRKRDEEGAA